MTFALLTGIIFVYYIVPERQNTKIKERNTKMNINMKRATSMLLLAAILTASASCGSTPSGNNDITDGQEQSTETTSGETTSPLYDLERKKSDRSHVVL